MDLHILTISTLRLFPAFYNHILEKVFKYDTNPTA